MSAPTATAPETTEPQAQPATSPEPTTAPPGQPERTFTQAELDAKVKERLDRQRRQFEEEQERIKREAAEKQLAEQAEFKTLAEQRAERIVELESQVGQVETLTTERDAALAAVRELVGAELEQAPDYVRDAIAERDPVSQLRYLNQHREKWAPNGGRRGIPATPQGRGLTPEEVIDQEERALRASGRYSI